MRNSNGSGRQDAAKRQRGNAVANHRLRVGAIRKQDGDWPPRCRVAALPRPVGWAPIAHVADWLI